MNKRRMVRPLLLKQERKELLLQIAELSRQIVYKTTYLFSSDKAEQIGCGCLDIIDQEYFNKQAIEIDKHAIGLIEHYNLHEEE
tara:strand:- start:57 stop:308 length:252 start_codon:yes stop_codon:yes gene_type:complete